VVNALASCVLVVDLTVEGLLHAVDCPGSSPAARGC
jgi:hypothetical protein